MSLISKFFLEGGCALRRTACPVNAPHVKGNHVDIRAAIRRCRLYGEAEIINVKLNDNATGNVTVAVDDISKT